MNKSLVIYGICFIAALVAVIWATYDRIFVNKDYILEYSISCNPEIEYCYEYPCDEEECEAYYYTIVRKNASDISRECPEGVEGCAAAATCLESDVLCEIDSCNPENESCVHIEAASEEAGSIEESQ